MSRTKAYLEDVSDAMGLEGEINDEVIAEARRRMDDGDDATVWADGADVLADAASRMLNRDDCCGGYRPGHPTTRKCTDYDWLPMPDALCEHFSGRRVIGLHTTTPSNTTRWVAFDIDAHGDDDVSAQNHDTAMMIAERLEARGYKPYIFDSNGKGGYHVWAVLHAVTPTDEAYTMAQEVADGLDVETFPKQAQIREGGFGNWIRLPGKHHKRPHWTRLWANNRWADAKQTIYALVEMMRACPA